MKFTNTLATSLFHIRFTNIYNSFRFPLTFSPVYCLENRKMIRLSLNCTSRSAIRTFSSINNDETSASPKQQQQQQQPWLIVGLGNPGKKYNGTRHNVGFEMVDAIAEAEGISMSSVNFKAHFGKGFIGNVPVKLAKPQTFMNSSGECVGAIASYYKVPLKQVLVIYDDLDLPFAKLRLLPKGGHGGHNGEEGDEFIIYGRNILKAKSLAHLFGKNLGQGARMRSVVAHFKGNSEFPRLRIGIGRPPGKTDPVNFVLRPFYKQEKEELDFTFQRGVEAVRILLLEGFNKSATFVNSAKSMEQLR